MELTGAPSDCEETFYGKFRGIVKQRFFGIKLEEEPFMKFLELSNGMKDKLESFLIFMKDLKDMYIGFLKIHLPEKFEKRKKKRKGKKNEEPLSNKEAIKGVDTKTIEESLSNLDAPKKSDNFEFEYPGTILISRGAVEHQYYTDPKEWKDVTSKQNEWNDLKQRIDRVTENTIGITQPNYLNLNSFQDPRVIIPQQVMQQTYIAQQIGNVGLPMGYTEKKEKKSPTKVNVTNMNDKEAKPIMKSKELRQDI